VYATSSVSVSSEIIYDTVSLNLLVIAVSSLNFDNSIVQWLEVVPFRYKVNDECL
jgi:hypothetical protein